MLSSNGFHVLTIDLPFHGESLPSSLPLSLAGSKTSARISPFKERAMDMMCDYLDALLDVFCGEGDKNDPSWREAVVLGHSFGGNLALHWAARTAAVVKEGDKTRFHSIYSIDGGYINLKRTFPHWKDCKATLLPPPFDIPFSQLPETLCAWYPNFSRLQLMQCCQIFVYWMVVVV